MSKKLKFITVSEDDDGQRLERWLKKNVPDMPYVLAQKLMRKGQIRIDGKRVKAETRIISGQEVKIPPFDVKERSYKPAKRELSEGDIDLIRSIVIYKDKDIIAINKPYGLASQGGTNTEHHVDAMLLALKNEEGVVPRLVHRLDKDTSGVMLFARSAKAAKAMGEMFKERDVRKIYWAVVTPTPDSLEGSIKAPIIKSTGDFEKMIIDEEEGKYALTEFRVIESAGRAAAFVAFWPRTGRTHQIRVHAAQGLGSSIIGDRKYRAAKDEECKLLDADLAGMGLSKRLHLHSRRIVFMHPMQNGVEVDITAPLDEDLIHSWKSLGFNYKYKSDPFADID